MRTLINTGEIGILGVQKIEILAVGVGCTGELSLSVGCEPSLRDDELFAGENLHRKKRRLL